MFRSISCVQRYSGLRRHLLDANWFQRQLAARAAVAVRAGRSQDASPMKRKNSRQRTRFDDDDVDADFPARERGGRRKQSQRKRSASRAEPPLPICVSSRGLTPRQLAALAKVDVGMVLRQAKQLETSLRHDMEPMGPEMVDLLVEQMNLNVKVEQIQSISAKYTQSRSRKSGSEKIQRMPVVTVMGHVDHGKTSLLDALRSSNIAEGEAGGITQRIGAFEVRTDDSKGNVDKNGSIEDANQLYATFIDTPGHAAFSAMRAHGATATDIVVLVVAADDGVMPQTVEAVKHAKSAGVPIVVAINKCDKEGADPDRVRYQLLEFTGLNTEQLGGDVQCVEVSAVKRHNLGLLVEAIVLQSELLDLQVDKEQQAHMVCIEWRADRTLGSIATVVLRAGTLRTGDFVVFQSQEATAGQLYGKVRLILDSASRFVQEAGPGKAVGIVGIRAVVPPGATCLSVDSEKTAKKVSHEIIVQNTRARETIELANNAIAKSLGREDEDGKNTDLRLSGPDSHDAAGTEPEVTDTPPQVLNVVVKGDVQGSADAVASCLEKLTTDQYSIRVLAAKAGDVTPNDVMLASATKKVKGNTDESLIVAFNVRFPESVKRDATRQGVDSTEHVLIYHLEEEIQTRVDKRFRAQETTETSLGKARVLKVFDGGAVAGCSVVDGTIAVGTQAKVLRVQSSDTPLPEVVHTGAVASIKHFSENVRSVEKGTECGISFRNWSGFESGDIVESVTIKQGAER